MHLSACIACSVTRDRRARYTRRAPYRTVFHVYCGALLDLRVTRSASGDAELFHAAIQPLPAEPELGGGLYDHAPGPRERGLDRHAIGLVVWQREVGGRELRPLREQRGTLDHVAQLAHVAGPVVAAQGIARVGCQRLV